MRFCFLIIYLSLSFSLVAQIPIDSLEQSLKTTIDPLEKIEITRTLVHRLTGRDFDKAFQYADQLQAEIENIAVDSLRMHSYYSLGRLFVVSSRELEKAKTYLLKAIAIAEKIEHGKRYVDCNQALAMVYDQLRMPEKVLDQYLKAIKKAEDIGYDQAVAGAYSNVGQYYHVHGSKTMAEKYFRKAVVLNEKLNYLPYLGIASMHLGSVVEDPDEGLKYLQKASKIFDQLHMDASTHAVCASKIGEIYHLQKKEVSEALGWYRKAIQLSKVTKDTSYLNYSYQNLGTAFQSLGQSDSARHYFELALDFYAKSKYFSSWQILTERLSLLYANEGQYKKAYKTFQQSFVLKDSINTKANEQAFAEANAKFETAEKEKEIARQKLQLVEEKQTRSYFIIGALTIMAVLAAIFQWFLYRQRQKKREAELALENEQKLVGRLRELDRLKTSFFTNISHELRTPLTLVAAPLDDALNAVKPGVLREHLQLAKSNTKQLINLVNEILDLSKLEAGKAEIHLSEVALLPYLRRLFYAFESIAEFKGIKLEFDSTIAEDLQVHLDKEKFEKMINNLLSNAIKFTQKGGKVSLKLRQKNQHFHFEISDTGIGIPAKDLNRIFDRFYQSTHERSSLQGGSGIGLALVKELAQLFKGSIDIQSEEGKGSQFILSLPLQISDTTAKASQLHIVEKTSKETALKNINYTPILLNGKKPHLLIVEDNPDMGKYLIQSLAQDYLCTHAKDGQEALSLLKTQSFDLISSDIMMPNMDGFAFRQKVNENISWRQIPFIMLTARAMEADKLKGFRLGVDDYLSKPFSMQELKARIHNLILNKKERADFMQNNSESIPEEDLSIETQMLKRAEAYVLQRLDDPQLRVDDLAQELNYSSRNLSRIMRKLTGLTPVNFILELRLQKARQLLESRRYQSVQEVRYAIGIESVSYFTTKFTTRFGKNPKEYL